MEASKRKQSRAVRWVEQSIAVALIALVAAPVAFAAEGGGATASAGAKTSVAKTLAKLRKQVGALQQQVTALQGQSGGGQQNGNGDQRPVEARPSGPAGGALTGTFPNPLLGPNTVGGLQIEDNAVGAGELQANAISSTQKIAENAVAAPDILEGAVGDSELASESVSSEKIRNDGVSAIDLAEGSVGSQELKPAAAVVGTGVGISKSGGPANAKVSCPPGQRILAGGYAWQDDKANSIIASAPSETEPSRTWIVRGMVFEGNNSLFAWATCIPF